MNLFKCKMCGGTIEFEQGATVGVCDSCGTKQTLPRLDDDKKANLYDRANHFRRNNDFDKAMSIYEQILNEDNTDAEAYWSLVLCRYGIEYVEDPISHKRIPTVNRAQFTSVLADEDYKSALEYADIAQKVLYEKEAKTIDDIQKGILAISQKEEPFDVFICYKETDKDGRRTQDSVLANDLYHQLTEEGFKVFFSRITLEDKLGTAYEPYIFAALNSSKVMVVLGTKPEHFNAVWVKNEWSRYLALIKNGAKKMLIPAYRDMDPYDLPEEFSHLQAQDMSKLGFMQDLIRGIKKIISADTPKETVKETTVVNTGNANTAPLLKRAFMFLEDGNWQEADEYCEKVLDQDPENAEAYLGKLMAEQHAKTQDDLKNCENPFDGSNNYQKVLRFADPALCDALKEHIAFINERNENARLTKIYDNAQCTMHNAQSEEAYQKAAEIFKSISGFNDADAMAQQCIEKADECRKDGIYKRAVYDTESYSVSGQERAIQLFKQIIDWRDSGDKIEQCKKKIEEIKAKEEAARIAAEKAKKKKKITLSITLPTLAAVIIFAIVLFTVIIPNNKYNAAIALKDEGKYEEAIAAFEALDGYKDSLGYIDSCRAGIIENSYLNAISLMDEGKYEEAIAAFEALNGYKDSTDKSSECLFLAQKPNLSGIKKGDTVKFGFYEQDNNKTNGKEEIEWIVLNVEDNKALVISKYALDCQQYNTSDADGTWEKCTLRKWLNDSFLNTAFGSKYQELISSASVSADKNLLYNTNPGNATTDKVFLLSITETEKYFTTVESRKCAPTAYAKSQGAWTSDSYKTASGEATCWWWLRSPGGTWKRAAYVYNDGSIYYSGDRVNSDLVCVRPALWINLE